MYTEEMIKKLEKDAMEAAKNLASDMTEEDAEDMVRMAIKLDDDICEILQKRNSSTTIKEYEEWDKEYKLKNAEVRTYKRILKAYEQIQR